MVLGKFPVSGRPTIWITEGQGPTALAVGPYPTVIQIVGRPDTGSVWTFFSHLSFLLFLPLFGKRSNID